MKRVLLYLTIIAGLPIATALGGARRFTYSYEATTTPPGALELENWVTWQTSKDDDGRFNQVDFRHEFEFGLTNRLQMGVYLADWDYETGRSVEDSGFDYTGSAVEFIYGLTNPATDLLGLAVYEEIKGGRNQFESESKIIAQKNLGPLVLVYNATLEAKWEGHELGERAGEFSQSAGASYEVSPRWLFGAELLHEIDLPDWKSAHNIVFGGPNVSYRFGSWWVTMTGMAQLTRVSDEANFQLRSIFGYSF